MIIVQDQDFPMKNWKRSKFHDTKRPSFLILTILTHIQAHSTSLAGKVKCFNCEWYFRRVFRLQGKTGHKNWKLRKYKYLVWFKLPLSLSTAFLTPPGEVKKLAGLQPPAWGWMKLFLGCSLVSTLLNSPAKVQWGVPPVTWGFTMSPGCIMVIVISDWGAFRVTRLIYKVG